MLAAVSTPCQLSCLHFSHRHDCIRLLEDGRAKMKGQLLGSAWVGVSEVGSREDMGNSVLVEAEATRDGSNGTVF
jgi:hypothetical protein